MSLEQPIDYSQPLYDARQERFCQCYFGLCKSGEEAAVEAGYSPKNARSQASVLQTKPNIQGRIQWLQTQAASARIMDSIEIKERLSEIARARLVDYACAGPDGDQINVGPESPNNAALSEITSVTKYDPGADGAVSPRVITKIKLHSPVEAIRELNKMQGNYAPEKRELTGPNGGPIKTESVVFQVVDQQTADMVKRLTG